MRQDRLKKSLVHKVRLPLEGLEALQRSCEPLPVQTGSLCAGVDRASLLCQSCSSTEIHLAPMVSNGR